VLDAVLPTPRLEFQMTGNVTLYAGAEVKQTNFRVDDHFGDAHGIPRLDHAILSYSEVRTGVGVDWKVSPIVTVTGEVGYQPYRNFDFYRADVRYHEDGGAPYGMISLHGAF
jgi:opacity protein-like surface antigen